ncbi:hypothetical protein GCM10029992_31960 [Glycomyces albus]
MPLPPRPHPHPGWSVTKTGPGTAVIVHHEGHAPTPADMTEAAQAGGCGCADWRTDADLDTDFQGDLSNVFPTGLYPEEWAPALKGDLGRAAERQEIEATWAAAKAARAQTRARFTTETTDRDSGTRPLAPTTVPEPELISNTEPAWAATDPGPPPFLTRPPREPPAAGRRAISDPSPTGIPGGPPPVPAPVRPPSPSTYTHTTDHPDRSTRTTGPTPHPVSVSSTSPCPADHPAPDHVTPSSPDRTPATSGPATPTEPAPPPSSMSSPDRTSTQPS